MNYPWRLFGGIAALMWLATACTTDELRFSAGAFAPSGSLLRDSDDREPFKEAIVLATSATKLTESAKTDRDWKTVESKWRKAISLLKSVPSKDVNYQLAQKKLPEYQQNLDVAAQKGIPAK
jgi:hypothetical protein